MKINREIKFRGKSKENGKWYYGYYCKETNNACYKEEYVEKHYIRFQQDMDWNLTKQWLEEVEVETIGQYTGLKDKNGVEIYEGDIIKFDSGMGGKETCQVYFDEYQLSLNIKNYPRGYIYDGICNLRNKKNVEVIGNIYDELKDSDVS